MNKRDGLFNILVIGFFIILIIIVITLIIICKDNIIDLNQDTLDINSLNGSGSTLENLKKNNKAPLVLVGDILHTMKIAGSSDSRYVSITYTNKSEYTITNFNLSMLKKDTNDKAYATSYDTVLKGETSPKFSTELPLSGKLEDMQLLQLDITVLDKNDNEINIEYDYKTKLYNIY